MHLCKTIILENTAYDEKFSGETHYLKYICVVQQYLVKLNTELLQKLIKNYQNENFVERKLGVKFFKLRLAKE